MFSQNRINSWNLPYSVNTFTNAGIFLLWSPNIPPRNAPVFPRKHGRFFFITRILDKTNPDQSRNQPPKKENKTNCTKFLLTKENKQPIKPLQTIINLIKYFLFMMSNFIKIREPTFMQLWQKIHKLFKPENGKQSKKNKKPGQTNQTELLKNAKLMRKIIKFIRGPTV